MLSSIIVMDNVNYLLITGLVRLGFDVHLNTESNLPYSCLFKECSPTGEPFQVILGAGTCRRDFWLRLPSEVQTCKGRERPKKEFAETVRGCSFRLWVEDVDLCPSSPDSEPAID